MCFSERFVDPKDKEQVGDRGIYLAHGTEREIFNLLQSDGNVILEASVIFTVLI